MTQPKGKYPNTFYRVSIKAIIRNDAGEVLVVKEGGGKWCLPGGGMNHGESAEDALKRELYEEALITADFQAQLVGTTSYFVDSRDAWLVWLVYQVDIKGEYSYGIGQDADDVTFINPHVFKGSEHRAEQLVYRFAVRSQARA